MKNLMFIVIILITVPVFSQQTNWCPSGAIWYYKYYCMSGQGYTELKYIGDTTINNISCKIISKKNAYFDYFVNDSIFTSLGHAYTYSNGNKVYYWNNNLFNILYDFDSQQGSNWMVSNIYPWCNPYGYIHTDSVKVENINGISLKTLYTSPMINSHLGYDKKIYERIGCLEYMFPNPTLNCGIMDLNPEGVYLICYQDNNFSMFNPGFGDECDFVTSNRIFNKSSQESILYPNPTNGKLYIKKNNDEIEKVILFNFNGVNCGEYSNNIIDLNNISNGLYFISIESKKGNILNQKLIINGH